MGSHVARSKVVSGGRVQLPANMRAAAGLTDGETVVLELVDGEIHMRSQKAMLARVRAMVRECIPEGTNLSDELSADRQAAAETEL